jgi:hypothetical protein
MLIQPKPYMDKLKLRHHAFGVERRRNMSKLILEQGTPFPKPIEYSDIDQAMFDWVDKKINLAYDGVRLPTYKLYSTQRISEYAQTWSQTDDYGNVMMNFKTITRDNNPQKGEITSNYFNIPGHKDFAMFYVPVLQENGTEAYDKYTMKQPFGVNFTYSVSIITNKMELLNEMNEKMHYEFSAIQCYISPNDHPMSMTLEDISDDSEYTVDDRKYYSQTFKIKVRGYIIRKEDYKVERVPSRFVISSHDYDATGIVNRKGKNRKEDEKVQFIEMPADSTSPNKQFALEAMKDDDRCIIPLPEDIERPSEIYEPTDDADNCCEPKPNRYYNKIMKIIMRFDDCTTELSFVIDKDMIVDHLEIDNVYDFRIIVNGESIDMQEGYKFQKDDEITVRITREDLEAESEVVIVGYDPESAFDSENIPESSLDEKPDEEHILINPKE